MPGTALLDALARMATDPAFAAAVRNRPELLVERYGLSPADAARIAATPIDTTSGKPRRLEERLSRSGGVFGSALSSAVDAMQAPTEHGGDSGGDDSGGGASGGDDSVGGESNSDESSGGESGGESGSGDARSGAGEDHDGGDGGQDDGGETQQDDAQPDDAAQADDEARSDAAQPSVSDGEAADRTDEGEPENSSPSVAAGEGVRDRSPDDSSGAGPAAVQPSPIGSDDASGLAMQPESVDPSGADIGPAAAQSAPSAPADASGPAATLQPPAPEQPAPEQPVPEQAADDQQLLGSLPPAATTSSAAAADPTLPAPGAAPSAPVGASSSDGSVGGQGSLDPAVDGSAPQLQTEAPGPTTGTGDGSTDGDARLQTEATADGGRLVTITKGTVSATFEVTPVEGASPQYTFGLGDGSRYPLANPQDQVPAIAAATNLDPAAVFAALDLDQPGPDLGYPSAAEPAHLVDGPREVTVTTADGSTHPATITPQPGGGYVQTSVNTDGTTDTFTVSADGVISHASTAAPAAPAPAPADGYPTGTRTFDLDGHPAHQLPDGSLLVPKPGDTSLAVHLFTEGMPSVEVGPDGTHMVASTTDPTTGQPVYTFARPDGTTITVAADGTPMPDAVEPGSQWHVGTSNGDGQTSFYIGTGGDTEAVVFAPEGTVAQGSEQHADGTATFTFVRPDGSTQSAIVAPDGTTLAQEVPDQSGLPHYYLNPTGGGGPVELGGDGSRIVGHTVNGDGSVGYTVVHPDGSTETLVVAADGSTTSAPTDAPAPAEPADPVEPATVRTLDRPDGSRLVTVTENGQAGTFEVTSDLSGPAKVYLVGDDGSRFLLDYPPRELEGFLQGTQFTTALGPAVGQQFTVDSAADGSRTVTVGEGDSALVYHQNSAGAIVATGFDGRQTDITFLPPGLSEVFQTTRQSTALVESLAGDTDGQPAPYTLDANPDGSRVLTVGEGATAKTFQLDRTVDGGSVLTSAGPDGSRVVVAAAPPPGAGPQVWTFVEGPAPNQVAAPAHVVSETGQEYTAVTNPDGSRDVAIYWPGDGLTAHTHITPNPDGTVTVSEDNAAGTGLVYITDPATLFSDLSPEQRAALLPQHVTGAPPAPGVSGPTGMPVPTGATTPAVSADPAVAPGPTAPVDTPEPTAPGAAPPPAHAAGIPLDQNAQLFTGQDGRSQVVVTTAQGPVTVYLPADSTGAEKIFGTTSDGRVIPVYSEVQDGGRVLTVLGPDAPLQTTYISSGLLPPSTGWVPPTEIQTQLPMEGQPGLVDVRVATNPDGSPEFAFTNAIWGIGQAVGGHALANPDGSWDVIGVHNGYGEMRVHAVLGADGRWEITPAGPGSPDAGADPAAAPADGVPGAAQMFRVEPGTGVPAASGVDGGQLSTFPSGPAPVDGGQVNPSDLLAGHTAGLEDIGHQSTASHVVDADGNVVPNPNPVEGARTETTPNVERPGWTYTKTYDSLGHLGSVVSNSPDGQVYEHKVVQEWAYGGLTVIDIDGRHGQDITRYYADGHQRHFLLNAHDFPDGRGHYQSGWQITEDLGGGLQKITLIPPPGPSDSWTPYPEPFSYSATIVPALNEANLGAGDTVEYQRSDASTISESGAAAMRSHGLGSVRDLG
ncbi:hypothetical protein [Pseudonocardia sp. GCM10023141]|uniref:hypothetical protein n=1 Tax=Pseudonocardia sp. GCM10023141 TaxID=3252653 RepID=UPI00360DB7C4